MSEFPGTMIANVGVLSVNINPGATYVNRYPACVRVRWNGLKSAKGDDAVAVVRSDRDQHASRISLGLGEFRWLGDVA
jgi:hypothetical protein